MRGFIRTTHGLSSCVCGGGGIFAVQMKTQREESCAKKRERKAKADATTRHSTLFYLTNILFLHHLPRASLCRAVII